MMLLTLKNIVAGYGNITALKGISHRSLGRVAVGAPRRDPRAAW